jgi:adenylyltransferase/sulfurtransferase
MFGQSNWKNEISASLQELQNQILDLQKSVQDLKGQNHKLNQQMKSVARKLVLRLPLSLESLEKGLQYDLIFSNEIESWLQIAREGMILDIRSAEEYERAAIPGSVNIPYDQLSKVLDRLSRMQAFLIVCDNGVKSVAASELLNSRGFHFLYVLKGGMAHFEGQTVAGEANSPELRQVQA